MTASADKPTSDASGALLPDPFLQYLVSLAEKPGVTMGLTLQCGGMLVSGTLVSAATYKEGFMAEFVGALEKASPDFARGFREGLGEKTDHPGDTENLPVPEFVHLQNARFVDTAGHFRPSLRGVWWRGRLSEVAGFTLGAMTPAGG